MRFRLGSLLKIGPFAALLVLLVGLFLSLPPDRVMVPLQAQGYSNTNPYAYFVPPGNCNTVVSANSTGTQGLTTIGSGTAAVPVVAAQTTNVGTNTHTFICNISPPNAIITTNNGLQIVDAVFFYGMNQQIIATQSSAAGSGTFNSTTVFQAITYPTPATSESASGVLPVRADSGNLVYLPTAANFNGPVTPTAGTFFSQKFTPATPIVWKTDLKQLLLEVTIQQQVATAIQTTSPGVLVHYKGQ